MVSGTRAPKGQRRISPHEAAEPMALLTADDFNDAHGNISPGEVAAARRTSPAQRRGAK